ncbi:hypothetical protein TL5120_00530 [Thalassovita autumnalis]|uniref:Uncharacterized protein n=1 Tax=Thalassovita autumnalis TaxID=2072972 RepID=A0A0P1GAC8_9RHOB|nr:hypothetical protein TL5120_00530 [Thalassovita autumnalis]
MNPVRQKIKDTFDQLEAVMKERIRPVSGRFQAFSGRQFHGMSSSMRLIL